MSSRKKNLRLENKSEKLVSLFFIILFLLFLSLQRNTCVCCYILVEVLNHLLGKSLFLSNLNLCA